MNSKIIKNIDTLSVEQTTVLKGIGILMILFHNYFIVPLDSRFYNEEKFNAQNIFTFLDNLWPIQWHESFSALCIFFGHYGVQIFIFCSAYGLAQVYNKKTLTDYKIHLKKRLAKLSILVGIGIVGFLIYHHFHYGQLYPSRLIAKNLVLLFSTVGVFHKDWLYSMFSGPFWYFGLTIQMYLVFPLLYRLFLKWGIIKCFLFSYAIIYPLYCVDYHSQFTVFGNLLGHLPEVFFSFYMAKNGLSSLNLKLIIPAVVIYPFTQYSVFLYPLSFLSILILLISTFKYLLPRLPKLTYSNLLYIGEISMSIFILNGFLRLSSFVYIGNTILRAERVFLYAILVIIISHFVTKLYHFILKQYELR